MVLVLPYYCMVVLCFHSEVGVYTTGYGGDRCEILRRDHRVKAIPKISSDGGTIFYLYSPGKRYSKSQKCVNKT